MLPALQLCVTGPRSGPTSGSTGSGCVTATSPRSASTRPAASWHPSRCIGWAQMRWQRGTAWVPGDGRLSSVGLHSPSRASASARPTYARHRLRVLPCLEAAGVSCVASSFVGLEWCDQSHALRACSSRAAPSPPGLNPTGEQAAARAGPHAWRASHTHPRTAWAPCVAVGRQCEVCRRSCPRSERNRVIRPCAQGHSPQPVPQQRLRQR